MNIPYYLEMYSRKSPEKTFLKTETNEYTYSYMNSAANKLASSMEARGITSREKVIILLENGFDFIVSYFAVLKIGAIVVPTNVKLTAREVKSIYNDANASAIIVGEERINEWKDLNANVQISTGKGNKDWLALSDLINHTKEFKYKSTSNEEAVSTILYTSGTTGDPKGVVFQNRSILAVAHMICIEMKMTEYSNSLLMMPLSHSAPLHLFFVSALLVGATVVSRKEFNPLDLLQTIEKEKVTHFFGAPVAYMYAAQVYEKQSFDISSIEWFVYGGSPMGVDEVEYIKSTLKTNKLTCVYGLTEAGPSGSLLFSDEHDEKVGSVGRRASLFTELKIVDENGGEVVENEIGEVVLRGLGMMKEYYNNPKETEKAYSNGWLRTGDLARYDDEGYVWIVDRVKDLIISGGVNIHPFEIEQELLKHELIEDVSVIGLPHREWGETVKAFYVSDAVFDDSELKEFLRDKLASYKIPRVYEKIDVIPRNSTGKALKHILRNGADE